MATVEDLEKELRSELSGYASDTPFEAGFGSTGPNEDVSNVAFVSNLQVVNEASKAKYVQWVHDNAFAKVREGSARAPRARRAARRRRAARG